MAAIAASPRPGLSAAAVAARRAGQLPSWQPWATSGESPGPAGVRWPWRAPAMAIVTLLLVGSIGLGGLGAAGALGLLGPGSRRHRRRSRS